MLMGVRMSDSSLSERRQSLGTKPWFDAMNLFLSNALRRNPRGVACVSKRHGRQDLLSTGSHGPHRHDRHAPLRQDSFLQIRRFGVVATVCQDLEISNGRKVLRSYAHKIGELVGSVAELKEEVWTYQTPVLDAEIATVTVGLDGTCMLMHEDGWREAMVGTVALYDKEGERVPTRACRRWSGPSAR